MSATTLRQLILKQTKMSNCIPQWTFSQFNCTLMILLSISNMCPNCIDIFCCWRWWWWKWLKTLQGFNKDNFYNVYHFYEMSLVTFQLHKFITLFSWIYYQNLTISISLWICYFVMNSLFHLYEFTILISWI